MWLDINGEMLVNLDKAKSIYYDDEEQNRVALYINMGGDDDILLGITTEDIAKGYIALIATNLRAGTPILSVTTTHEGAE
jgi:hypothetical protein